MLDIYTPSEKDLIIPCEYDYLALKKSTNIFNGIDHIYSDAYMIIKDHNKQGFYKIESIGHYMYKDKIANVFVIVDTLQGESLYKIKKYKVPTISYDYSKPEEKTVVKYLPIESELYDFRDIPYLRINNLTLDLYDRLWSEVQNMKDNERMVMSNICIDITNKTKIEEFDLYVQKFRPNTYIAIINIDINALSPQNLYSLKNFTDLFLRKNEIVKLLYKKEWKLVNL